jgi:P-type Ca2+ transporter type 2C
MSDKLITRATLGRMLLLSLVMAVVTISLYRYSLTFGEAYARTMALTTMVFFQLFNVFNSRSATQSITQIPFFTNRLILITVPISIILQLAALRIPFLQQMLGTVALDTSGIIVAFMAASSILFADELRKWVLWLLRRWAISQIESKEEYTSVK